MDKRQFDVYGIGNALMDLQLMATEEDLKRFGLEKAGMRLVAADEQEILLSHFAEEAPHLASGGSAANTMIALAQLGGSGAYGCLVGDDSFGRFYLEEMKELGIELHSHPVVGKPTGTCVILITPDAERTMNTHLGVSSGFGPEHVSEELLSNATWLYIEGYLFASDTGREAIDRALTIAKASNVKVAVTLSDGFIVDVFNDAVRKVVPSADLVFANVNETMKFTGKANEDEAFAELSRSIPNVVMTMSERGAKVRWDGSEYIAKSYPATAVDDTGAGDMFAGGFLYGITQGRGAEYAARLACFLASRVVSQMGPRLSGDVKALAATLE